MSSPEEWDPGPEDIAIAEARRPGVSVLYELYAFRQFNAGARRTRAEWASLWERWCAAPAFGKAPKPPPTEAEREAKAAKQAAHVAECKAEDAYRNARWEAECEDRERTEAAAAAERADPEWEAAMLADLNGGTQPKANGTEAPAGRKGHWEGNLFIADADDPVRMAREAAVKAALHPPPAADGADPPPGGYLDDEIPF